MKVKFLFILLLLWIDNSLQGQALKENFYVKVLNEELQRNINKLHLPELEKPFFIAYNLRNQNALTINAERGIITTFVKTPVNNRFVTVKLLVGDYHRNFNYMMYNGFSVSLPDDDNADEYKRLLWLETDRAYKNTSQRFSNYMSSLKRVNVNEQELALDDLSKITPVVEDYGSAAPININTVEWEKKLSELSSVFKANPFITSSYCRLAINNYEDYLVTSEGTIVRKPGSYVTFVAFCSASGQNGNNVNANYAVTAKTIDELPTYDMLMKEVKKIFSSIKEKQSAKSFENSYMGPVMFEGNAVDNLVNQCFQSVWPVRRKSILNAGFDGSTNYEEKIGQKLVASDISLIAIPSLKIFNNKSTTGYYQIDDEGVRPPDSLVIIHNGVLKSLLNGRVPTKKFPISQGFGTSSVGYLYNPGVLKLVSSKTVSSDSMKAQLLQLARDEGLSAAYIVKEMGFANSEIYRLDAITGKEELMNECRLSPINLKSLRRFALASDKMQLSNAQEFSIIVPESIIINEVEIEKAEVTSKPKPIIVSNPLLEKEREKIKAAKK